MNKYGKEKHGMLGKCTKLRFTPNMIKTMFRTNINCGEYTNRDFEKIVGGCCSVPVEIALDVEGNYEAVCEKGIEIH